MLSKERRQQAQLDRFPGASLLHGACASLDTRNAETLMIAKAVGRSMGKADALFAMNDCVVKRLLKGLFSYRGDAEYHEGE